MNDFEYYFSATYFTASGDDSNGSGGSSARVMISMGGKKRVLPEETASVTQCTSKTLTHCSRELQFLGFCTQPTDDTDYWYC